MSASARFERLVVGAASAMVLVFAGWSLASARWTQPIIGPQFPMLDLWHQDSKTLPRALAASLHVLVLLDVLLASGLALMLCLSSAAEANARVLRRSLAAGALSALYLFVLRPLLGPPAGWMAPLDVAAFLLGALAVADLIAFLTNYPRSPDPAAISAYWRSQSTVSADSALIRLIHRARVSVQARLDPAAVTDLGKEARVLHLSRNTERILNFVGGSAARVVLLAAGLLGGLLFAIGSATGPAKGILGGLTIISPFLPLLGAQGLTINYRSGSTEDRRRIGWIYLGPTIGLVVASVFFFLMLFGAVAFRGAQGEPARLFGIDMWRLVLVGTFDFVPFVIGAFLFGLTFAMFYNGAVDPRLAIRRGAAIGFLGIVLSTLFVAFESLIQSQVVLHMGLSAQANAAAAGALAAIVLAPLRKRIEHGVGRAVERYMPISELADGVRETVTVCFIDMSGYTALSERDQPAALLQAALLQRCGRNAAERAGGKLIKSLGDAVMLRFPSPQAAIGAATTLVRDYRNGAATLGVAPLPLHGGLHHGEVVAARDGDLYGAAVNLASRLCSAAKDGQLVVSDTARASLSAVPARDLGELRLKNVQDPVRAYEVDWQAEAPSPLPVTDA